jgi:hypothetical protein
MVQILKSPDLVYHPSLRPPQPDRADVPPCVIYNRNSRWLSLASLLAPCRRTQRGCTIAWFTLIGGFTLISLGLPADVDRIGARRHTVAPVSPSPVAAQRPCCCYAAIAA